MIHDIGRIKFKDGEKHHLTGADEAERILKEFNYSKKIIKEVKHCILSHRGSQDIKPKTLTAKIVANADAMAHFDILPLFFYCFNPGENFEETLKWVNNKIERDWNKKLTLSEAKRMVREKYKAIRLLLDSLKEYE